MYHKPLLHTCSKEHNFQSLFPSIHFDQKEITVTLFFSLRKWNWDCSKTFCCKSWWKDKRGEAFWKHLLLLGKNSSNLMLCHAGGRELLLVAHRTWALSPCAVSPCARQPACSQCSGIDWLRPITHSPWPRAWQSSRCENWAVLGEIRAVNFSGHHDQLPVPQPPFSVSCQSMKCIRGSAPGPNVPVPKVLQQHKYSNRDLNY